MILQVWCLPGILCYNRRQKCRKIENKKLDAKNDEVLPY